MVDKIYGIKNKLIEKVEKDISERGIDRVDGETIDMIKNLAETEKACWEAQYYRSMASAMESQSQGYGTRDAGHTMRQGYGAGTGSSAGYGTREPMHYDRMMPSGHVELMEPLRMALQTADPDEREHLRNEVRTIMGMA